MNVKTENRTTTPFLRRGRGLILPLAALVALAGCDSSTDLDDDHHDLGRVEIQTRGAASQIIAVWTGSAGWTDGQGNAITELPNPRDVEGAGLLPLRVGESNASLTARFFFPNGDEIQMGTLDRGPEPARARTCTEYEGRYAPTQQSTNVIAWPNIRHPQAQDGPFHFAELSSGSVVGIFHCDHLHFYAESAGTVDVRFLLWHVDHADGATDPIRIRVEPAN
jgi:hypothetical protein